MFGANSHITAKKFPEFGHNQVKLFPNFNMPIIGLHINVVEYNCPLSTWLDLLPDFSIDEILTRIYLFPSWASS